MKPILIAALLLWPTLPTAQTTAQTPALPTAPLAPEHNAGFDEERKRANELYLAGKVLEALPLYEDLCRQDQTIAVFAERHGAGLMQKAGTLASDPAAEKAMQDQARAEILRAQKLGDNSPYVQQMLNVGSRSMINTAMTGVPLTVGYTYNGTPEAQAALHDAEIAFGKQDYPAAVKLYQKAVALDPHWYSAPLFTGDAYFRMKDFANAGLWYQKAIAIDPNRDTAYRYWSDALWKAGDSDGAKLKAEQAIVAEPYNKSGWLSLQQWATLSKTAVSLPNLAAPRYQVKDGALVPDASLDSDAARTSGRSTWLVYETCRVKQAENPYKYSFSTDKDGSTHPSGHYHSLTEEQECLHKTVVELRAKLVDGTVTEAALDPSLKLLLQLDRDGVLPCWILLNGADQGIKFDYPAYRATHRDQLIAYIDRYIVHVAP